MTMGLVLRLRDVTGTQAVATAAQGSCRAYL